MSDFLNFPPIVAVLLSKCWLRLTLKMIVYVVNRPIDLAIELVVACVLVTYKYILVSALILSTAIVMLGCIFIAR